jgi:hypothetical protein
VPFAASHLHAVLNEGRNEGRAEGRRLLAVGEVDDALSAALSVLSMAGPERSAYTPAKALSDTVMTAIRTTHLPAFEHSDEYSPARHDAVAHERPYLAGSVALLAYL